MPTTRQPQASDDDALLGAPAAHPGHTLLAIALALLALQGGFYAFVGPLPIALGENGFSASGVGAIIGAASVVQILAAPLVGPMIDRYGSLRLMYLAGLCYSLGALVMIGPLAEPESQGVLPILGARAIQGVGLSIVLPAGLAMVPRIVPSSRSGVGLGVVASSNNLALVALSPLSLLIFASWSFQAVAMLAVASSIAGVALFRAFMLRYARAELGPSESAEATSMRVVQFRWRIERGWLPVLAALATASFLWGVLVAHLPYPAHASGADVGLFFVAHGITILLVRVPTGWLLDSGHYRALAFAGVTAGLLTCLVLVGTPTDLTLLAAGVSAGASAGLVVTTLLVLLAERVGEGDQGRAFALFSAALALGISAGSIATGPMVERSGLGAGLVVAAIALVSSGLIIQRITSSRDGLVGRPRL